MPHAFPTEIKDLDIYFLSLLDDRPETLCSVFKTEHSKNVFLIKNIQKKWKTKI